MEGRTKNFAKEPKTFYQGFSVEGIQNCSSLSDDDDIIDDDCDDEDEDCEDDDDEDEETYSETDGALDFNDYYSFNEDLDDIGGMGSSAGEGTSASTSGCGGGVSGNRSGH